MMIMIIGNYKNNNIYLQRASYYTNALQEAHWLLYKTTLSSYTVSIYL